MPSPAGVGQALPLRDKPQDPVFPIDPVKIADLNTTVPGTTATFSAFGNVAIDPIYVVFDAWYTPAGGGSAVHGLFTNRTGALTKLLDNTQSIGGKQLADYSFGPGGEAHAEGFEHAEQLQQRLADTQLRAVGGRLAVPDRGGPQARDRRPAMRTSPLQRGRPKPKRAAGVPSLSSRAKRGISLWPLR